MAKVALYFPRCNAKYKIAHKYKYKIQDTRYNTKFEVNIKQMDVGQGSGRLNLHFAFQDTNSTAK